MEEGPENTGERSSLPEPPPLTPEERETLLIVYDNAGEVRNTHMIIFWMINTIFFVFNPAALAFLIPALLKGTAVPFAVFLGGTLFNFAWNRLLRNEARHIIFLTSLMGNSEELLRSRVAVFTSRFYRREIRASLRRTLNLLNIIIIYGFLAIWVILTLYTLFSLLLVPSKPPDMCI